jgi:hypothetical protein
MKIIGCDYHPSYQQIAMGEQTEHRLTHDGGQVLEFYQNLAGPVRVQLGIHSGLSAFSPTWDMNCGSGKRERSAPL